MGGVWVRRIRRTAGIWILCLLLAACSTVTPLPPSVIPERPAPTQPIRRGPFAFTLAYSRADGLDPFKTVTRVNRDLAGLIYEGLWEYDRNGVPGPRLAKDLTAAEGRLTVTLREDALFSDGTPVTAAEVIASFDAARESEAYGPRLRRFGAAAQGEKGTVVFTLTAGEPFPTAALTFPIVKPGEEGMTGTGPYRYDPASGLIANPLWGSVNFPEIRLLDLVEEEERLKGLELGHISYMFTDLSGGQPPRVTGAFTAVPMEYLMFLGVNAEGKALGPATRQALDKALNRERLTAAAFGGYAVPALTLFPEGFAAANGFSLLFSPQADREGALALLADLEGPLTLTLAVNEENEQKCALARQVAEQLGAVGITVNVTPLPFQDYLYALRHGRYDLYIGEIRLPANMDLDPLLKKGGAAFYGPSEKDGAVIAWAAFCKGETDAAGLEAAFAASLPYIPLCWRCGLAAYDRALTNVTPTGYDPYAGLDKWNIIE